MKIISLIFLLLLSACQTTKPAPDIEIEQQLVAVTPNDDMLVNCEVVMPPDNDNYLALKTWSEKESMLVENIAENIQKLGICNIRWQQLRQWKIQAKAAVDASNAASAAQSAKKPHGHFLIQTRE